MSCPLAVFVPEFGARSETFIRRHVQDLLPYGTLAIGGPAAPETVRDWDARGPLIDLGAVSEPQVIRRLLRDYGVRVLLGEYLDASLPWLPVTQELGIAFFAHAHGYDVSRRLQEPEWPQRYLAYADAAGLITMSETSRRRLIDLGLPGERIHTIPYGVDVPSIAHDRPEGEEISVLAVGRMVEKKGPLLTLEAFRRAASAVPSLRLDFVGSGPLLPAVARSVSTSRLDRVTLHGGQPHEMVQALFGTADLFVQHSVTDLETGDEEGLPVAILEAMAAGLPVVATDHAGIPEAVQHGTTGFLVAERDVSRMADRIVELARDRELRVAMGRAGWRRARDEFAWERERDQLLTVLGLRDVGAVTA